MLSLSRLALLFALLVAATLAQYDEPRFVELAMPYVKKARPNGPMRFGKRRGPSGPMRFGKRSAPVELEDADSLEGY